MTLDELIERQIGWHQMASAAPPSVVPQDAFRELQTAFRMGNPVYFMDRYFCRLVDEARRTIPDTEALDPSRLPTSKGWIFLEEPAELPPAVQGARLCALGWFTAPVDRPADWEPGAILGVATTITGGRAGERWAQRLGHPWSAWPTWPGRTLSEQMRKLDEAVKQKAVAEPAEQTPIAYPPSLLHEARWFYTAVNLMANKLTLVKEAPAPRALRRRSAREGVALPDLFRTVTLRRVEAARQAAGAAGQARDWQWQWQVRGHWRHYQDGKIIFIESYLKGPVDKPLKTQVPFFKVTR